MCVSERDLVRVCEKERHWESVCNRDEQEGVSVCVCVCVGVGVGVCEGD